MLVIATHSIIEIIINYLKNLYCFVHTQVIARYFWAVVNNFRREKEEETEAHQHELLQNPVVPLIPKRR